MSTLVNCTPHSIHIFDKNVVEYDSARRSYNVTEGASPIREIAPSGSIARCGTEEQSEDAIDGIPTIALRFTDVEGLPEPQEGTFYIVSAIVRNALPSRSDLLTITHSVRDTEGKIVGCLSFAR